MLKKIKRLQPGGAETIHEPICGDARKMLEENNNNLITLQSQIKMRSNIREKEWQQ
jgi:hypothetical protein